MPTNANGSQRKFLLKWLPHLALLASLPFLSGCFTICAIQAANTPSRRPAPYASADKIDSAGITGDNQLCVFFEKGSTNSGRASHFSLEIPIEEIATNRQSFRSRNVLTADPDHPGERKRVSYAVLSIHGSAIRNNWALLETQGKSLKPVPIGPTLSSRTPTNFYHYEDFTLLSNATQTIHLTRSHPIEFVYVDPALERSLTLVSVEPTIITGKQPGYYATLPITIPADVATSPLQGLLVLWIFLVFRNGGC